MSYGNVQVERGVQLVQREVNLLVESSLAANQELIFINSGEAANTRQS